MKKVCLPSLILVATNLFAQLSHDAMYGFGCQTYWQPVRSQGMGMVGVTVRDSLSLNTINPATWTDFKSTSIQGQMFFSNLQAPNANFNTTYGRFNGFSFKFPIGKKIGFALGLNPLTRVDGQKNFVDSIIFQGSKVTCSSDLYLNGGLSEFFIGTGLRLNNSINLGLKAKFIFGDYTTNYNTTIIGNHKVQSFWESHYTLTGNIIGIGLNIENSLLNLGTLVELPFDFKYIYKIDYSEGPDTLFPTTHMDFPYNILTGIKLKLHDKINLYSDYQYTFCNQDIFQKFYLLNPSHWRNSSSLGCGIEYVIKSAEKAEAIPPRYLRAGLYYHEIPIQINNMYIKEKGLTIGYSNQLFNYLNRVDFAIIYGLRSGFLSEEKFLNLSIGITTGEIWFKKFKRR